MSDQSCKDQSCKDQSCKDETTESKGSKPETKARASSCPCPPDCARMMKRHLALAAGVALLAGAAWLGGRHLAKGGCPCTG